MKKCCPKNSTKPTYHERAQVIVELQFKIYLQNVKICSFFKFYSCFMHVKNWHEQKAHPRSKCTKVTQNFSTLSFSILSPAARTRKRKRKKKNWNYKVSPTLLFHGAIILLSLSHFLIVYILSVLFNGYSKGGRRSLVHMRDGKRSLSLLCVVVNVSFHIRKVHTVNIFPKEKLFN